MVSPAERESLVYMQVFLNRFAVFPSSYLPVLGWPKQATWPSSDQRMDKQILPLEGWRSSITWPRGMHPGMEAILLCT